MPREACTEGGEEWERLMEGMWKGGEERGGGGWGKGEEGGRKGVGSRGGGGLRLGKEGLGNREE